MSFMYNPFPFDDPKPVNRPELAPETIASIVAGGTPNVVKKFAAGIAAKAREEGVVIGLDGYTTARWDLFVGLLHHFKLFFRLGRIGSVHIGIRMIAAA